MLPRTDMGSLQAGSSEGSQDGRLSRPLRWVLNPSQVSTGEQERDSDQRGRGDSIAAPTEERRPPAAGGDREQILPWSLHGEQSCRRLHGGPVIPILDLPAPER